MKKSLYRTGLAVTVGFFLGTQAFANYVKIEVAAAPSIYQKTFEAVVAAFERAHPDIDINLVPAVREDEDLVQRELRSAVVGATSDVLFVSPNLMRPLIDRGLATSLDDLGATSESLTNLGLVPGSEQLGTVNGTLYALPFGVSTPVIAYNADLVRKAGGDPDNFPTTWASTTTLIQKIHDQDSKTLGGFFEYDNTGNWTYKALVATLGGRMMSEDDKTIVFDNAPGREAFQVLRAFGEAGQGQSDMTRDQARQAFAAGRIGILVTSSGALAGLEKQVAGAFLLKAAPLPLGSPDGKVPAAGTVSVILSTEHDKREAAWKLLQFVVSPEAQNIIRKTTGLIPVNQQVLDQMNDSTDSEPKRPNQQAAIAQLSRLTEWYAFPGANSIKITNTIIGHLQSVLTLKRMPDEELQAMRKDVTTLLEDREP